jgi:hypothetical protein
MHTRKNNVVCMGCAWELGQPRRFCTGVCEEKSSLGREPPFGEDLSMEAEE